MRLGRFDLPFSAALAGIVSFTMLGLIVNGIYSIVHAILGQEYLWGFWSMRCTRIDHPVLHGLMAGLVVALGVVGYRMLNESRPRAGPTWKFTTGLALLMLPLWDLVCLCGYVIQDITGSLVHHLFPFAGGELAWLSYELTGSVYSLTVPVVLIFTALLVKVVKGPPKMGVGWGRSILTAAALGAIMVIAGTLFWSIVTVRALKVVGVVGA
jgi:hypothetical protein